MGLFQQACITYDANKNLIGKEIEGKEPLAPISHSIQKANIEITISFDGDFKGAIIVDEENSKTIIPVTEESASRSAKTAYLKPHPLCDKLKYLLGEENKNYYLEQLEKWINSEFCHEMLFSVYKYVKKKTLISDLLKSGVLKLDKKGNLPEKSYDLLVRWNIVGIGLKYNTSCWKEQSLMSSYIKYYNSIRNNKEGVCMLSGQIASLTNSYPKGIVDNCFNAKIISANDNDNFTYRGRFLMEEEASSIGYESIQKANNALHWLVKNQGSVIGKRAFVCWNPEGIKIPVVTGPIIVKREIVYHKPSEYKRDLELTIKGYKNSLPTNDSNVIVVAFDAATTGRLATTYYKEIAGSDFLTRLEKWDKSCCWYNGKYGIQSPSMSEIIECCFGNQIEEEGKIFFKTDEKLYGQQIQRLIRCRVDCCKFPGDIVKSLIQKASSLFLYDDKKWFLRQKLLFTVCAVIKKYYFDYCKEELSMLLEPTKPNRSYQFGRLLAVLEKAERDTFEKDEDREPNAMRLQSAFCKRPLHMFRIIQEQVKKGYYPKLPTGSRIYYEKLISEIMSVISSEEEDLLNRPLEDLYLIGYYLQRKELYTSNKDLQEEK